MFHTQNDRESSEIFSGGEKPGGQFPNENAVGRHSKPNPEYRTRQNVSGAPWYILY
jgi:hypothetical protein